MSSFVFSGVSLFLIQSFDALYLITPLVVTIPPPATKEEIDVSLALSVIMSNQDGPSYNGLFAFFKAIPSSSVLSK